MSRDTYSMTCSDANIIDCLNWCLLWGLWFNNNDLTKNHFHHDGDGIAWLDLSLASQCSVGPPGGVFLQCKDINSVDKLTGRSWTEVIKFACGQMINRKLGDKETIDTLEKQWMIQSRSVGQVSPTNIIGDALHRGAMKMNALSTNDLINKYTLPVMRLGTVLSAYSLFHHPSVTFYSIPFSDQILDSVMQHVTNILATKGTSQDRRHKLEWAPCLASMYTYLSKIIPGDAVSVKIECYTPTSNPFMLSDDCFQIPYMLIVVPIGYHGKTGFNLSPVFFVGDCVVTVEIPRGMIAVLTNQNKIADDIMPGIVPFGSRGLPRSVILFEFDQEVNDGSRLKTPEPPPRKRTKLKK